VLTIEWQWYILGRCGVGGGGGGGQK